MCNWQVSPSGLIGLMSSMHEQEILKLKKERKKPVDAAWARKMFNTTVMHCTDKRQASKISGALRQTFVGIADIIKLYLFLFSTIGMH